MQPIVRSNVTSFHNISGKIEKNTIKVVPFDRSLENSLQFQSYAKTIASFLKSSGFSITDENQEPDYIVFVSYGIGSGKESLVSTPVFGQTGGGTTFESGSVYGSGGSVSYSGSSYTMPTYGIVGSSTSSITQYTRNLAIDIVDASSLKTKIPKKIYEGRVKSTGKCGDVNYVMDEMVQSMFRDFPGTSGVSKRIDIPSNGYNEC
ncbi:hypothetical protein UR09_06835 [Candidatus Nitromaritima sp. SCGC AAA799-A02]|nr:hypothetical protein UR09_06835 [Candidatus Nitromaritima sp. SCGC AAA799-A02]